MTFIKQVISMRKYLMAKGLSKAEPARVNPCLTFLEKHLAANPYDTDYKMAQFYVRHADKISVLFVGRNNPHHETCWEVHRYFLIKAKIIFLNQAPHFVREGCDYFN